MSNWEAIKIVNRVVSVADLLKQFYGLDVSTGSPQIHCPFPTHEGEDENRSARYYETSNSVHCFAEAKTFRAYDILKLLGISDQRIFANVQEYIDNYGVELDTPEPSSIVLPKTLEIASRKFRKDGSIDMLIEEIDKLFAELAKEDAV